MNVLVLVLYGLILLVNSHCSDCIKPLSSWKRDVTFKNNDLADCIVHLRALLEDWQKIPAHSNHKGGSLFDHSSWTAFGMKEFENKKKGIRHHYIQGLGDNARRFAVLAALFHDTGKSGVGSPKGRLGLTHVKAGAEMLLNQKKYEFINNKTTTLLGSYLQKQCPKVFNQRILEMLSVTTSMHYQMADKSVNDYINEYYKRLNNSHLLPFYNITEQRQLLEICAAVSAADVLGSHPVHKPMDRNDKKFVKALNKVSKHGIIAPIHSPRRNGSNWIKYDYGTNDSHSVITFVSKVLKLFDKINNQS